MKTSILSLMITALVMSFGFGAQAKSKGYTAASQYMQANHGGKSHKKSGNKKKVASNKKQKREVASEKKHKKSKSKSKKKKQHH